MNKHVKAVYSIMAFLTIWCTWNSVKNGVLVNAMHEINSSYHLLAREVGNTIDRLNGLEQKATDALKEVEEVDANKLLDDLLNK